FILHGRIVDYGFKLKGLKQYFRLYSIIILAVLPFVIISSFSNSFYEHYPLYSNAGNSWADFFIWESIYGFNFIMLEFFFRGFILFALARYFGAYSIFIMLIPYTMIHFGKPVAETIGSILAGIALGTMSLRTQTIFGGAFIHIIIAWSMDILALLQKGHSLF
ncbi:MAG: CPBP family glutamic-type intramembrane protease, partial [bacterium]